MKAILLMRDKEPKWKMQVGDLVNSDDIVVLVTDIFLESCSSGFAGVCVAAPNWPGKYCNNWIKERFTYFPDKLLIEND